MDDAQQPIVLRELPNHPAPDIDLDAHVLSVRGEVETPAHYRLHDLLHWTSVALSDDFACLEGWVVPDQQWEGIPLGALLDRSRPRPGARYVLLGAEDFTMTLPIDRAREGMLALRLNGEPLPLTHGGPMRFVLPGGECYTSIKWLDRIELLKEPREGTARDIAMKRIGLSPGP